MVRNWSDTVTIMQVQTPEMCVYHTCHCKAKDCTSPSKSRCGLPELDAPGPLLERTVSACPRLAGGALPKAGGRDVLSSPTAVFPAFRWP